MDPEKARLETNSAKSVIIPTTDPLSGGLQAKEEVKVDIQAGQDKLMNHDAIALREQAGKQGDGDDEELERQILA